MSIASKLQDIANCKVAIKNAIETKGVTVGSVPLSSYADKILQIQTGGQANPAIVKVQEEDWDSTTKVAGTLYALI